MERRYDIHRRDSASEWTALNNEFVACRSCDALLPRPTVSLGQQARCPRCHSVILTNKSQSAERVVALMLASALLFVLAVFYPFLKMQSSGLSNEISVADATLVLWNSGYPVLSVACMLLILAIPLARILLTFAVALALLSDKRVTPTVRHMYGAAIRLAPWSMADVFMLGVIVSLVKVGQLADISVGIAFWSLVALSLVSALASASMCADTLWQRARHS
ncbi:MAG: paraquat-inducible protein A [Pseudomonadota bacterium]